MKRSHDHTQLTRLAAISLCLVMCLSALPMLAPSASAAPAAGEGRGYVCITFDDGYMDMYQHGFPIMAAAGIPGTAFIVTDWIGGVSGTTGLPCMGVEELLDLQANGWTIGSHTLSHARLTEISLEEAKREMRESKAALEAIGIDCTTFAYPHSSFNATLVNYGCGLYDRQRSGSLNQFKHDYPNGMPLVGVYEPKSLEEAKKLIDRAVATDSVLVLLHHHVEADGYLPVNDYNLNDLVDYIVETGIRPIGFADLPNSAPHADVYVWDGEGADDLASNAQNWRKVAVTGTITNDVAPVSGADLVWNATSNTPCTWDLDIVANSWNINHGYTSKITQGDVDIRVSEGLTFTQQSPGPTFQPNQDRAIYVGGDLTLYTYSTSDWVNAHIIMTGYKSSSIDCHATIGALTVEGVAHAVSGTITTYYLDVPGYMDITSSAKFTLDNRLQGAVDVLRVTGRLGGEGALSVASRGDMSLDLRNIDVNMVSVVLTTAAAAPRTIYILASADDLRNIKFNSNHASHSLTVDFAGNSLAAERITVGERCVVGNGSVYTSTWDSTAGSVLDNTNVVLRDGGSAVLAPGQSFNRLEIASDDGRSASWSMTATGTVAPIVTGLKSGSYLWYLDGVEQGEVEADKDGTIALSYMSTGLHTLEVKPTPMIEAMDGLAAAVGIVAVLAVLGGVLGMLGTAFGRLKF
jgi:peptidoglycan/xylan/chitin deacetylase (PgdA/CDA1 family)